CNPVFPPLFLRYTIVPLLFHCVTHVLNAYLCIIISNINFACAKIHLNTLHAFQPFKRSFYGTFTMAACHTSYIQCRLHHDISPFKKFYFQCLLTFCGGNRSTDGSYLNHILTRFSRSEFDTTLTELNAIAPPAIHGASSPAAAIGMPALL